MTRYNIKAEEGPKKYRIERLDGTWSFWRDLVRNLREKKIVSIQFSRDVTAEEIQQFLDRNVINGES